MPASTVFVAPYALPSTLKFVSAAAMLPETVFGIIAQESRESFLARVDPRVGACVAGFVQVQDAHDPDQLEAAVRQMAGALGTGRVDSLIGILEPLQEALAIVRERLRIRGMDAAEARRFRDKAHMKDVLRANDLPCARHVLAHDRETALAFAREVMPLVAKPPAGAGAKDTFRVERIEDLESWMERVPPSPSRPLLLEEFVQGTEYSFDSVSIGGQHVFHSISEYAPTPLQVMETPWIQWTVLLPREIRTPEFASILEAGPRALDALGMVEGMTHMEWFRRHDGSIAISEVAARPPGAQFTTMISYAHDTDFYRVWAEASVFGRFQAPERKYAAGAAYLRGQSSGAPGHGAPGHGAPGGGGQRVARVTGLDEIRSRLGDLVVEADIPSPGQPKSSSYEGEGYVILRHPETDVVRRGLQFVVETLRVGLEG
ncbi:Carbamoyl-phosphate synthase large chain [Planctomycetes bacterium Poly30]|uniref:Carbamoyl-phosphate synthase large chain n=1 Tax=Saltatorellus ferox TaxID=2528018 RepID=A0A518ETV1_9BACT|nr:Carbamoyl-phosphate synthase large chain [Planctomycetes bacterium Poly30]